MHQNVQVKSVWSWAGLLKLRPNLWYVQYNIGQVQCQSIDYETKAEADAEADRLRGK